MNKNYFPEKSIPKVYCYTDTRFPNGIKVGYTTKTAFREIGGFFVLCCHCEERCYHAYEGNK